MSEETNVNEATEGGWSGLKKTIIGTLGTLVTAGGVWLSTFLGGNHEEPKAEAPAQTAAPAAPVVINLSNNNTNQQKQSAGGTTTIIKEKTVEKPSTNDKPKEEKKKEEDPW